MHFVIVTHGMNCISCLLLPAQTPEPAMIDAGVALLEGKIMQCYGAANLSKPERGAAQVTHVLALSMSEW